VGESIAYNFKLRMTEKSLQMDGWNSDKCAKVIDSRSLKGLKVKVLRK